MAAGARRRSKPAAYAALRTRKCGSRRLGCCATVVESVGWILGTCGLLVALDGFARTYAIQGMFIQPGSLPAVELVAWFNAWTWQLAAS